MRRLFLTMLVVLPLLGVGRCAYAVFRPLTVEERALAEAVRAYVAASPAGLVADDPDHLLPSVQTFSVRPATGGLATVVCFGVTSAEDTARVRAAVQSAFGRVPGLKVLGLEFYVRRPYGSATDGRPSRGRATLVRRMTLTP